MIQRDPASRMTVAELIHALSAFPPDLPVYVRGYEAGVDDVSSLRDVSVVRDIHSESYYGRHEVLVGDPEDAAYDLRRWGRTRQDAKPGVFIGVAPAAPN